MNKLRVLCLVLLILSGYSNNPNQAGPPAYDPYSNRGNQQQQQQQQQQNGGQYQQGQQRPPNGQQNTQGYQQEQEQQQQYSQTWPISQTAPPIKGVGSELEANSWSDPRYFNPSSGTNDQYQTQPTVSIPNNHNSNGFQPDDRDVYDPSYSLPVDGDNPEDGYGAGDEDELYRGLERIVAADGFPRGEFISFTWPLIRR
jgi:hypothetical protein